MKYFIDCEFIERGFMAPIDLISIGVVALDGREFYAVSTNFKARRANQWVKENVLPHLPDRHLNSYESPCRKLEDLAWMPRNVIAERLREFVGDDPRPEFWGWCCGFDYVLISQLIGFNNWPSNWPYYFRDIQQEADRLGITLTGELRNDTHNALEDAYEIRSLAATLGILKEAS